MKILQTTTGGFYVEDDKKNFLFSGSKEECESYLLNPAPKAKKQITTIPKNSN
jgi:ribosomal protein L24E